MFKTLCVAVAWLAACCAMFAPSADAQVAYPTKPVRIIVPFTPGGGGDLFARAIAAKLSTELGQQFIVDNRPGAGTAVGTELAAPAAPDGYTLLLFETSQVVNLSLKEKVPYDLQRDFAPVARVAAFPVVLVVPADSKIRSVADLVALAKATPGGITYVSGGSGTMGHLAGEMLKQATGIAAVHVPYKGTAAAIPDLIAGRAEFFFATIASAQEMVKAGRLRVLAVTTDRRMPSMPDVPTMIELGFSGFNPSAWFGFLVPAKTPAAVIDRLHGAIARAVASDDVLERLHALGLNVFLANPAEFDEYIRAETARWAQVIKTGNIKTDM